MTKEIGKNVNRTDESDISIYQIDSTSSVDIFLGESEPNKIPFSINVTNNGNRTLWVKPQLASVDNDKKGIRVAPGQSVDVLEDFGSSKGVYVGPISAIFDQGDVRDVVVIVI